MGDLERDAKKLVRDLADDNRQVTAWFYGFFIVAGIIAGIVAGVRATIHDVPWQVWATFGGGLGALALVVLLVVVANRRAC